jgi:hypothetical protein
LRRVIPDEAGLVPLCDIHGHISQLEELVSVYPVLGSHDIADAGLNRQRYTTDVDFMLDDLAKSMENLFGFTDIPEQDAELVPTKPG